MLSIARCKELLGEACPLSDEEIELMRDQLYVMANVALDAFDDGPARATLAIVSSDPAE